jgi:hypothetical protein
MTIPFKKQRTALSINKKTNNKKQYFDYLSFVKTRHLSLG